MDDIKRKIDHIELAGECQTSIIDNRFNYEPLLNSHPVADLSINFLGKNLGAPLWISSLTGGSEISGVINRRLAKAAREFSLGLALGSCRPLLENSSKSFFEDFNLRPIIGRDLPFYANLGIAQIESLISTSNTQKIVDIVGQLDTDGLVIHVNPLQEWMQPEGDRITRPPVETIERLLELVSFPIIVKEVGQGMGPKSLERLIKMGVRAIEFAAFGGTNFSKLEQKRSSASFFDDLSKVGHNASEMVSHVKRILSSSGDEGMCKGFIISGGVTPLDGYYLMRKLGETSVIGHAYMFAKAATESYEKLSLLIKEEIDVLKLAYSYLELKE